MDEGASGLANETTRVASGMRSRDLRERVAVSLEAKSSRGRRAHEREDEIQIALRRVRC